MDLVAKLEILADAAKYDVACTSSGIDRDAQKGKLGNTLAAGCCHSFAADGRCITLLKVLMTNVCVYDCAYCVNRASNEVPRAAFKPRELADLTIAFYRRNYIEGLFLSSGVIRNPDYTTELMIQTLSILREEHGFRGYIHAKAVPGNPNKWEVYVAGGRKNTHIDAIEWAREATRRGAGEILLTSMDRDGSRDGFDCHLTRSVARAVDIPVIASGGVGKLEHFAEGIIEGEADAVLAASVFHFGELTVRQVKESMRAAGIPVRL